MSDKKAEAQAAILGLAECADIEFGLNDLSQGLGFFVAVYTLGEEDGYCGHASNLPHDKTIEALEEVIAKIKESRQ